MEGVRGNDEGRGQGPGNPRLRAGVGWGGELCQPYPEVWGEPRALGRSSLWLGWKRRPWVGVAHTWEKAWLLQRGLSFLE